MELFKQHTDMKTDYPIIRQIAVGVAYTIITILIPAGAAAEPMERLLYGNVYGTITAQTTGAPIADAEITLSVVTATVAKAALSTSEPVPAVRKSQSGPDGRFIVNSIPIRGTVQRYTLVVSHPHWDPVILSRVPVLPGAFMSMQATCRMTNNGKPQMYTGIARSETVTLGYRHVPESRKNRTIPPSPTHARAAEDPLTLTVFATREGLVGHTTANGHEIVPRDHFVALPYTETLSSEGGDEFQVELQYNGRTVIAPVWDIGPWNIHDNYWDPESEREIYSHLSHGGEIGGLGQGLPESQAAFQDNFNNGKDEFDRDVTNPAGIDLADGTFWDDLGLTDNAWITVRFLWTTGGEIPPPDDGDGSDATGCFLGVVIPHP